MEAIATLLQDDPWLKLPKVERLALRRSIRSRFDTAGFEPLLIRSTTFSVPNTPFGIAKVPVKKPVKRRPLPNLEPLYWHCMWFADLIAIPVPKPHGPPSIDLIQRIVARKFGLTRNDIISQRRTANIVLPRQVAMYLCKTLTPRSFPEIGRRFGGRDHTTAIHSVNKIAARCVSDLAFAGEIETLKAELRA